MEYRREIHVIEFTHTLCLLAGRSVIQCVADGRTTVTGHLLDLGNGAVKKCIHLTI